MLPEWLMGEIGIRWFRSDRGIWEDVAIRAGDPAEDGEATYCGTVPAEGTAGGQPAKIGISTRKAADAAGSESPDASGCEEVYIVEVWIGNNDRSADNADDAAIAVSGLQLTLPVRGELQCIWKPHLAPLEGMVVGDKSFRSPAVIFENEGIMAALVPDLDDIARRRPIPHVMDYVRQGHYLMYGLCNYEETGHVYYKLTPQSHELPGESGFRFYLVQWAKAAEVRIRDYRPVERFLWERFARPRMSGPDGKAYDAAAEGLITPSGQIPDPHKLERYVRYAYGWALQRWSGVSWQQFELDGRQAGGVVFIVTARQKPGHGQEEAWREPKSLWNQAWFCGLRSAYGYRRWGGANRASRMGGEIRQSAGVRP